MLMQDVMQTVAPQLATVMENYKVSLIVPVTAYKF